MLINDWDENLYRVIAKKSGSKQAVEDVSYARFAFFHSPDTAIHLRDDEKGFVLGALHQDSVRIIGMATDEKYKKGGDSK